MTGRPEVRHAPNGVDWLMPGMATVHSHAFQRLLRGKTQRQSTASTSFWSWRSLMYRLAEQLDPDDMFAVARLAYAELAMSGVTAVGEFHYLHHDPSGRPYAERTIMAARLIAAARDVGLRICLIRCAYFRGGANRPFDPAQKRFADQGVAEVLEDVSTLQKTYGGDPGVTIGLAAHSVRAVPLPHIIALARQAAALEIPFHMHVSEQRLELEECLAEHGKTPVRLLADHDVLSGRFVAIHATHLAPGEADLLGSARAFICLCRTTERDLGDGLPPTRDLTSAGGRLCFGVDSHAGPDAFEEMRAVELDERSRLETRLAVAEAPALLFAATASGYEALGFGDSWREDTVLLHGRDPSLAGMSVDLAIDCVVFGAIPRAVAEVTVLGRPIVGRGSLPDFRKISEAYEKLVHRLDF